MSEDLKQTAVIWAATWGILFGIVVAFGWVVAFVCGLIASAYCVGVFYGAGSEIAKREANATGPAAPA